MVLRPIVQGATATLCAVITVVVAVALTPSQHVSQAHLSAGYTED